MITAALQQHPHSQLSVSGLCELLGVNRAWYYAQLSRELNLVEREPSEADVDLRAAIEELVLEFPGYGYRRVTKALARAGYTGSCAVNHKRVLRIMREESLLCQLK